MYSYLPSAARFARSQHGVTFRYHMIGANPVVRTKIEITAPSGRHGSTSTHPISHRVYKDMAGSHQCGDGAYVVTIDGGHKLVERLDGVA